MDGWIAFGWIATGWIANCTLERWGYTGRLGAYEKILSSWAIVPKPDALKIHIVIEQQARLSLINAIELNCTLKER